MDEVRTTGFKKKTQEKIIRNKMNHWLKTIEDETLRDRVQNSLIVTGGAIASMLMGSLPNDFDLYMSDVETCADLAKYYVEKLQSTNPRVSKMEVISHEDNVEIMIKSSGLAGEEVDLDSYRYFECETDKSISDFMETDTLPDLKKHEGKYIPLLFLVMQFLFLAIFRSLLGLLVSLMKFI